jgi:hypothetical protein
LTGNTNLRAIEVVDYNADMAYTLNAFGNLRHLTALKTISLHFTEGLDDVALGATEWSELDAILAQAGDALESVSVYAFADWDRRRVPELAAVRGWLPSVAGKISVHVPSETRWT